MRKTASFFSLMTLLSFVMLSTVFVYAAPGDLDTTFGTGGKVTTDVTAADDTPKVVMIQPDGKILIAGSSGRLVLVRYNSDGSLDTTYGTNGKIISSDPLSAFSVGAFQPDGKLVTANIEFTGVFFQARYRRFNTDGTADTTFGNNGTVSGGNVQSAYHGNLVIQPDGKILVVGGVAQQGEQYLTIGRLNTDGTVTDNFTGFQSAGRSGLSVSVQPDGKILVGGRYTTGTQGGFLIRFNSNGTADGSEQNTPLQPYDLIIQANSKIVIAGTLNGKIAAARFNSDLSFDTGFGVNGVSITGYGGSSYGKKLIIQNNGSIVVGGGSSLTGFALFALVRFLPNGIWDSGFGQNGIVLGGETVFNDLTTIVSAANDKILALGDTLGPSSRQFLLIRYLADASTTVPNRVKFDFDGDGKADISVFRPSDGIWYLNQSTNGFTGAVFGFGTDRIAPADYDGDGKTDIAVFRPSNGIWYIQRSTAGFTAVAFGQNGDQPVPGDYDGDGKADISVFRPSNGAWYRINSGSGQFSGLIFGQNGDKPLIADFNGDSISDITVFRPSNANFYWIDSIMQQFQAVQFGLGTDIPVLADYDGDGRTDISVFRPSNEPYFPEKAFWLRLNSGNGQSVQLQFGQNGDIPAAADYDGDGKTDIAVFRPSSGYWYLNNFAGITFGTNNDKPIPSAFQ